MDKNKKILSESELNVAGGSSLREKITNKLRPYKPAKPLLMRYAAPEILSPEVKKEDLKSLQLENKNSTNGEDN